MASWPRSFLSIQYGQAIIRLRRGYGGRVELGYKVVIDQA